MQNLSLYFENGRRAELVDSKTLCAFLGVKKSETLLEMAKRGDLPQPVYLNMSLKGRKGRNEVRWSLPDVFDHIGLKSQPFLFKNELSK